MLQKNLPAALKEWEKYCAEIAQGTGQRIAESPAVKTARISRLKKEYADFFAYYFPNYATAETAEFHKRMASIVCENEFLRFVCEIHRGGAKSTHLTIGIPLFLAAHADISVMLLVSNTEEAAIKLLDDLRAQITANKRLANDYGVRPGSGKFSEKEFSFYFDNRRISCVAVGLGQSPRGIRFANARPDYIIVDDAESRERSRNPRRVEEAVQWINEDLSGTFDGPKQRLIFANNRPFEPSILAGLLKVWQESPFLKHLRVNALDFRGRPTWPEKYTKSYWSNIQKTIGRIAFSREYMNTPVKSGALISPEMIRFEQPPAGVFSIIYIDPSFSASKTADFKAAVDLCYAKGRYYIKAVYCRRMSFADLFKWITGRLDCGAGRAYIEANFAQHIVIKTERERLKAAGIYVPLTFDNRKKPNKYDRIESLVPLFENGDIVFAPELQNTKDFIEFESQLLAFEKGSKYNDDAPDCLEGAVFLAKKRNLDTVTTETVTAISSRRNYRY